LCENMAHLKEILRAYQDKPLGEVIDSLFPVDNPELAWVNEVLVALKEDDDAVATLYRKFSDFVRSSVQKPGVIRVMTLGMSKGLDAEHVFILGASSGNIPGKNRNERLSNIQFINEHRRLLYVGITRAKLSITITWSRTISYRQSQTHQTGHVGVRRRRGSEAEVRLTVCEFLQGFPFKAPIGYINHQEGL
jgi:superfamily I DNA/RNA helicase